MNRKLILFQQELRNALSMLLALAIVLLGQFLSTSSSASDTNAESSEHQSQSNQSSSDKQPLSNTISKKASVLKTDDAAALQQKWQSLDDPESDGWETEALTAAALKKLKQIVHYTI